MSYLGFIFILLAPLAGVVLSIVWFLWRAAAFARSRTAAGAIIGWKPIQCEGDFGKPNFERYLPIARFRPDDGVWREARLAYPRDEPLWPAGEGPTIYYVMWPWLIAGEGRMAFIGPPIGLFCVTLLFLTMSLAFGVVDEDWTRLRELIRLVLGSTIW